MSTNDRAEALARLAALGVTNDLTASTATAPAVELSGDEVYAGGDVKRVLIKEAHLTWTDNRELMRAETVVGDTVLITEAQAKRLDALGATAKPADVKAAAKANASEGDQLESMKAADLVAHVNQHPEDRAKVLELELAKPEAERRATVVKAAQPDEDLLSGENPEDDADEA